jgi:hypothetical protein
MRSRRDEPKPIARLTLDLRLGTEDFAGLTPSQIKAVFDGVATLAAMQHGNDPDSADTRP